MTLETDRHHITITGLITKWPGHLNVSVVVRQRYCVELFSWQQVSTPETGGQQYRGDTNYGLPVFCGLRFVAYHDVVFHGVGDVVHSEH